MVPVNEPDYSKYQIPVFPTTADSIRVVSESSEDNAGDGDEGDDDNNIRAHNRANFVDPNQDLHHTRSASRLPEIFRLGPESPQPPRQPPPALNPGSSRHWSGTDDLAALYTRRAPPPPPSHMDLAHPSSRRPLPSASRRNGSRPPSNITVYGNDGYDRTSQYHSQSQSYSVSNPQAEKQTPSPIRTRTRTRSRDPLSSTQGIPRTSSTDWADARGFSLPRSSSRPRSMSTRRRSLPPLASPLPGPLAEKIPLRQRITLILLILATTWVGFNHTAFMTAQPLLVDPAFRRYNGSLSWATVLFLTLEAVFTLLFCQWSDHFGRALVAYFGFTIALVGSTVGLLATHMTHFCVARALEGIGSAGILVATFVALQDQYPEIHRGFVWLGCTWSGFLMAALVGPLLGEVLIYKRGWQWLPLLNLIIWGALLAGLVLSNGLAWSTPYSFSHQWRRMDGLGALLFLSAVMSLVLGIVWAAGNFARDLQAIITLFAIALCLGICLAELIRRRKRAALLPSVFFYNRNWLLSSFGMLVSGAVLYGMTAHLHRYLKYGQPTTWIVTFQRMCPVMLAAGASAALTGFFLRFKRYRALPLIFGSACLLMGLGLLSIRHSAMETGGSFSNPDPSANSRHGLAPVTFVEFSVLVGLGLGTTLPTYYATAQSAVPSRHRSVAGMFTHFSLTLGGILGLMTHTLIIRRIWHQQTMAIAGPRTDDICTHFTHYNAEGQHHLRPGCSKRIPKYAQQLARLAVCEASRPYFLILLSLMALTFLGANLIKGSRFKKRSERKSHLSAKQVKREEHVVSN
ncbi:hypothetical protein H4R33_002456 [Dimargaris cristalligena]|nr:hypothetical protein H4R33_002456 [Dimargaris cristalligena]